MAYIDMGKNVHGPSKASLKTLKEVASMFVLEDKKAGDHFCYEDKLGLILCSTFGLFYKL